MVEFLNNDGGHITSSRDKGSGEPITDVSIGESSVGFDVTTDSFKSKIVNSVELQDVHAFQSSMILHAITGRSSSPAAIVLTPPSGAKGVIIELFVQTANAAMVDGEGANILVIGHADTNLKLGGVRFSSPFERRANYRQTLVWYPGVNLGDIMQDSGAYQMFNVGIPIPKQIEVTMSIKPAAENNGGVVSGMTLGWLT